MPRKTVPRTTVPLKALQRRALQRNALQRNARRNEPNRGAIIATAIAAFLAIAGIAVVDPILPAIADDIGLTPWEIELLFTAYIGVMAIGMIPAVMATGRFGYKKVLIAGVVLVGMAAIAASFSTSILQLATLRGLWGLGNAMFFATGLVLMVALANNRAWVVGLFETVLGLGFAVGPMMGGLLGEVSWRLPFAVCGGLMLIAVAVAATRLRDPEEKEPPVTLAAVGRVYQRRPFVALAVITAAYNFVFFTVLGFTPLFLHIDVIPLGLAFTGWGIALAVGILVIGHRLANRIGHVQTVGVAIAGILVCVVLLATSHSLVQSLIALIGSGVFMGLANANLTDLALGLGSPDRRVTTGAFNVVRWGAAAPAPVVAGWLAEHVSLASPFWVSAAVLGAGLIVFLITSPAMAGVLGESRRVPVLEEAVV